MIASLALSVVLWSVGSSSIPGEASLRAADAAQLAAVSKGDLKALESMTDASFLLFAPEGYVGDRARLLKRFKNREAGYDKFDRTVDAVALSGATGIVMGHEKVTPAPDTATAKRVGVGRSISRRFTNVYVWKRGRWFWLARHANEEAK